MQICTPENLGCEFKAIYKNSKTLAVARQKLNQCMTYFIKRFDRTGPNKKLAVEDFAQLSNSNRDTKYTSSMEKVIEIIEYFCTFPKIEFAKLFKLTLFNFLIGNEDMHLKNFSLITGGQIIGLSPAYDLVNSSIAIGNPRAELALPLKGKKINLTKKDFLEYFAQERLGLNQKVISKILTKIQLALPKWQELINVSFLSEKMRGNYLKLLLSRCKHLGLS